MDAQAVGKEKPFELAALGRLGDRDHMIEVHHQIVAGGPCIRMAPGAAYAAHRGRYGHQLEHDSIRSEEHTSELQSLMRISYAVFCLKKKKKNYINNEKLHPKRHILITKHTHKD